MAANVSVTPACHRVTGSCCCCVAVAMLLEAITTSPVIQVTWGLTDDGLEEECCVQCAIFIPKVYCCHYAKVFKTQRELTENSKWVKIHRPIQMSKSCFISNPLKHYYPVLLLSSTECLITSFIQWLSSQPMLTESQVKFVSHQNSCGASRGNPVHSFSWAATVKISSL